MMSLSKSEMIKSQVSNTMKQSRLVLKQQEIKKKLKSINSRDQLERVYNTIKSQNTQLKGDIAVLKQHLNQVQQKKRLGASNIRQKNQLAVSIVKSQSQLNLSLYPAQQASQYQKLKQQLQEQYKLMRYLKSSITSQQEQSSTQQLNQHKQSLKNKVKELETSLAQEKKRQTLLIKQNQKLEQTMKNNEKEDTTNSSSILTYEQENIELRKKILAFKQQGYKHESKAAQVIDQIYKKKQILTQYKEYTSNTSRQTRTQSFARTKSLINNNLLNIKDPIGSKNSKLTTISKLSYLQPSASEQSAQNPPQTLVNEISLLKQRVELISQSELKLKQREKKQKQILLQESKSLKEQLKEWEKVKTKKIVEENHLKAKIKNIVKEKQMREKMKIITINAGIQEDEFDVSQIKDPLRRDFAGVIGSKVRFDDRFHLKDKKRTFIKGLTLYENQSNLSIKGSLVAIRAIYTDQQTNLLNVVPIPGQYLQKCKQQHLMLPEDDFVKLIKVKYNTQQARITKIQIRSNRNLKYEFGEKKSFQEVNQHEVVYAFDIGLNQFPVSVFGSFCQFRNCWYLESFGVEINSLS